MLDINHYSKLNLKYNPFSYLNDQELLAVTEERINLKDLAFKITASSSCFVEFYGKKGRGKSTLLQSLYSNHLPNATFVQLKKKKSEYVQVVPGILIVDSFQLLSIQNKLQLLKNQNKLIIGSHYSHKIPYFSRRKLYEKVNFNKLELDINFVKKIVQQRIELACLDSDKESIQVKDEYLERLLVVHGNNLRAIQTCLYDFFLNPNKELYELY
ncbi:hypothetical protein [uncultured Tenacibaculum sp.]|uniref:hypothetical protein n=1 Tax=uncultured Tenacibaculum sp. TaxID=174713 RepID=UPI0026020126|nr:hypothetical protein [uncultured Tenacibaculum sp.]